MWQPSIHWWEFIARGLLIYVFLLVLLRLTGKRQIGQLSAFDLVLLLVLSNSVQNAMNGGDSSITGGLISALTLVAANALNGALTDRSKTAERIIEGRPELLIHNGHLYLEVLERARLTQHELHAAMRAAGCTSVSEVHYAILENTGRISILPKKSE